MISPHDTAQSEKENLSTKLGDAIEAILPGKLFVLFVFGDDGSFAISNGDRQEMALAVRDAANQILSDLEAERETYDRNMERLDAAMKSRKPRPDADREIIESLAVCPTCGQEVQLGPDDKPLPHRGCEVTRPDRSSEGKGSKCNA